MRGSGISVAIRVVQVIGLYARAGLDVRSLCLLYDDGRDVLILLYDFRCRIPPNDL